jgi:hypothetical protein
VSFSLCHRPPNRCRCVFVLLILVHLLLAGTGPAFVLASDGDVVDCTPTFNISQSDGFSSADPFLVADPTGIVHLFWAERVTGAANSTPNVPDAVMYSVWNGNTWSTPVDIFLSPQDHFNRRVTGLRAIMDEQRTIHLLWQGPDNLLLYSSAHADEAGSARLWQTPQLLATDETGTQFSAYLAYEPPETLHVIYGRGISDLENRSVVTIRSTDGGQNWSEPVEVYRMLALGRGPSNVRLLASAPNRLYATWTEWDQTGNGQAVFFARSTDTGSSWDLPVRLAERKGLEYERDWATLTELSEGQLVVFWEGGFRAYRQAQYSYDGGDSWSEPIDTLDWLIADNGFAEFVKDSAGRVHLFVSQRVREGNPDKGGGNAIWHTVWEGEQNWREPRRADPDNPANYISVALSRGNEVHIASFSNAVLEILTLRCTIEGAPTLPVEVPNSDVALSEAENPNDSLVDEASEEQPTVIPEETVPPVSDVAAGATDTASSPGPVLIRALVPTLLALFAVIGIGTKRVRGR